MSLDLNKKQVREICPHCGQPGVWREVSETDIPTTRAGPYVHIPSDLYEAFDVFIDAACVALSSLDQRGWTDDERRIFEWMQSGKWKG